MKPAYQVMKTGEWNYQQPSVMYQVGCDCSSPDCGMRMEMEVDHDYLTLLFYKKLTFDSFAFGGWKKRIITAFKVLFLGYIEVEECLILKGEEHIQNFIDALEEGKEICGGEKCA